MEKSENTNPDLTLFKKGMQGSVRPQARIFYLRRLMNNKTFFFLPFLFLLMSSCENEVELNAPKKDITVAYGILDGGDSLHYVKVNKSFLPERNARTYASEEYSKTYYDNASVHIRELEEDGSLRRNFELKDSLLEKEAGLFQHDEPQKLYYFEATDLDPSYRYELRITINEGEENEKSVKGSSSLVGPVNLTSHNPGGQFGSEFYFYRGDEYNDNFSLEWGATENAAQYNLTLRIHYSEIFTNGDTVRKSLDWRLGSQSGDRTEMRIGGEPFYRKMANSLSSKDGLNKRRMHGMELLFKSKNEELNTYSSVSGVSSSIVQHRPQYSNLDTAAVGIFASARHQNFEGFSLSSTSMDHLIQGSLTAHLNFAY